MQFKPVPDTDFKEILYDHAGGIAKITINRPEVRNAFTPETIIELREAFHHAHMAQPHHSLQPQMPTCLCVLMSNPSNVAMTFEIGSNPVDRILQNVNLSRKECFGGFESRHGW